MPLMDFERQRIISIYIQSNTNKMPTQIARIMQEEGTQTTYQAVQRTISRWKEMEGYKDRPKSGRPKTVPEEHYRAIDAEMAKNDELTASDLLQILQDRFGSHAVKYSLRTIASARQDLWWTFTTARYCQAIREVNKFKRPEWCKERLREDETFEDVIITDESSIQLEFH